MDQPVSTAPKPFCFVLMPFSSDFDDIYQIGIKEACTAANAYCERVDEQIFNESMLERIYNQIAKADFIIADMTGRNPNVFYEVGYAHALGQRTILLTKEASDIPFDLKHFPHIVYGTKLTALRDELTKRVKWHVDNPVKSGADSKIGIELYVGDVSLSDNKFRVDSGPVAVGFRVTIHNNSFKTYQSGAFKIAAISSLPFWFNANGSPSSPTTQLPDGRFQHMLSPFKDLLPNAYDSFPINLATASETPFDGETEITLRVLTDVGTRDFIVTADTKHFNSLVRSIVME